MPNYKKLTINAETGILNQKVAAIKEVNAKLQAKDLASGAKGVLEGQRGKLAGEIGEAVDKVLAACDVAEGNNRDYCQYIVDGHTAAKVEMDQLEPLVRRLETGWDDQLGRGLQLMVASVKRWRDKLKTDDAELRAVKMVEEYRGNGWKTAITGALPFVPDRKGPFEAREKNRQGGIQLSASVVSKRERVAEYVTRAETLEKTAQLALEKELGLEKNYAKLREEAVDFANSVEKDLEFLGGQLKTTIDRQVSAMVKNCLSAKVPTKELYKPLLAMEPKLDSLLKDAKGKVKTLRIQFGEISQRVKVIGMPDRYFKPQHARAHAGITKLEAAIETYVKGLVPARKLIEQGKKLK